MRIYMFASGKTYTTVPPDLEVTDEHMTMTFNGITYKFAVRDRQTGGVVGVASTDDDGR